MGSTKPVFQCGNLTVRSAKASKNIKLYDQNEHHPETKIEYTVSGITPIDGRYYFKQEEILGSSFIKNENSNSYVLSCPNQPIFFEQTHYTMTVDLPDAEDAYLFSPNVSLCESATWDPDIHRLTIPVHFGNDLGDFELCWEWIDNDGSRFEGSISGQVLSTKLDIYSHFKWMIEDIEQYDWIQLDLLRKTTWGWSYDDDANKSLKTWLLIFQDVRREMGERFFKLLKQHRRKLIPESRMLRADKIRKIPPKIEELVAEGVLDYPNRRYLIEKKSLNVNTVENRYMKHILFQTIAQLHEVIDRIESNDSISDIFKERLHEWAEEWGILKQHRFWKGIGTFKGLRRESLILSQDPLYSGIRRSWFLLQQGLEFFDNDLRGGIQNAAQLYEIWCLVKIMELLNTHGFTCQNESGLHFAKDDENASSDDERSLGTIKFYYSHPNNTKLAIELLYQPTANSKPDSSGVWDGVMSTPVVQKPDIVLRLMSSNHAIHTWIFDAKYRIDLKRNAAPDDALNQMHRYRDAIIWSNPSQEPEYSLYRESIGAYVLYPGRHIAYPDKHSQLKSIKTANIGAFPLRPYAEESELNNSEIANMFETLFNGLKGTDSTHIIDNIYVNAPRMKK